MNVALKTRVLDLTSDSYVKTDNSLVFWKKTSVYSNINILWAPMETSDSECFESADEDLSSDDENTETIKNAPEPAKIDENVTRLKKLKLEETKDVTLVSPPKNNNTNSPETVNTQTDDENNVSTCKVNKKDTVKKLGTKVGPNIDNKLAPPSPTTNQDKNEPPITAQGEKNDDPEENPRDNRDTVKELGTKVAPNIDSKPSPTTNQDKNEPPISTQRGKNDDPEENLWDDDEIDWGQEKEPNMWDNNDWEPVDQSPQDKEKSPTSWGYWGTWGVSSILSTATQSVSTLTQGISTVLETGIGVPDPEELARINKAEKEKKAQLSQEGASGDDDKNIFGLGNLVMGVSHLTKLVETTGTKVISGGLDTLETIGKKTMEVLQEGDPGLKKKRAFLKIDQDKPVLSQLLREAKEKADQENKILEEKHFERRAKNYETLFDDHQGLVHLEALEMLSKQCDIKLQTLLESYTDNALTDMQETMDQVKELCELPDEDEDDQTNTLEEIKEKLESAVTEINIPISYKKLIETWEETETWLHNLKLEICDERELHQQAIETLAQLTAIAVEQFHKTGELLLVKEHRSTADEADSLVQLTTTLTSLIGVVAAKFSDKLNAKSANSKNKEGINGLITNVFFEAANSSSYIQDAFQLLIPVLQVGAI